MSKCEEKYCPRCNQVFECKSGSIMLCQCNKIKLPEAVIQFVEKEYKECLCLKCLSELVKQNGLKAIN